MNECVRLVVDTLSISLHRIEALTFDALLQVDDIATIYQGKTGRQQKSLVPSILIPNSKRYKGEELRVPMTAWPAFVPGGWIAIPVWAGGGRASISISRLRRRTDERQ